MKNFRFNTICNITQKPKELQRYNRACRFTGKCAVIKMSSVAIKSYKCHQEIAFRPVSNRHLVSLALRSAGQVPTGLIHCPVMSRRSSSQCIVLVLAM